MTPILAFENPLNDVLPHTYFSLGPIHVTNTILMATIAAGLMLLIFPKMFNKPDSEAPKGSKNFFESILEYLRVEVFRPALKESTDRYVPFLWTMFFFILFCNVLACIPFAAFFDLITVGRVTHFGGAATGTITVTAALAIAAFFMIHAQGIDMIARSLMDGTYGKHGHAEHGHDDSHSLEHPRSEALAGDVQGDFGALTNPTAHYADADSHGKRLHGSPSHEESELKSIHAAGEKMTPLNAILSAIPLYLWNFAPHPFRPPPGSPWQAWIKDIPMFSFLLVLELIGAGVKPFALCIRLFANMVAGHVLLATLIALIVMVPGIWQIAVGAPVAVLDVFVQLLEIFVAFLQAYIFTFLTTLFLASSVAPEH
jgi:F0F1-type ATP synthase membrane subunit a